MGDNPVSGDMRDGVHLERTVAGLARETLFDVVADVERYPEFLAGWNSARIRGRADNVYCTDQSVRIGPVGVEFTSRTTLLRPERIDVTAAGPWFEHFAFQWQFDVLPENSCRVRVSARVRLRSPILNAVVEGFVPDMVETTASAFEARARRLDASRKGGAVPLKDRL